MHFVLGHCIPQHRDLGLRLRPLLVFMLLSVQPAYAVNWEGHDEWFHDDMFIRRFTDSMPAPKVHPFPSCEARAAAHAANIYEQVPVPGLNCIPKPDNDSRP